MKFILSQGIDGKDTQDDFGETPLTKAASALSKEIVEVLLENRANINFQDKVGNTAKDLVEKWRPTSISMDHITPRASELTDSPTVR